MSTLCATKTKESHTEPESLNAQKIVRQHPCQIPGLPPIDPVAVAAARVAAGYVHPFLHGLKDTRHTTPVKDKMKPAEIIKSYSALVGSASGKVQAAPLKDIGNTNTKVPVDVVKIPSSHGTNEQLLHLVSSQWTTGKSSRQTSQCKAAIRSCLLADMRPFTIAKHVVKQVNPEHQATEYERAKSCAQRIQKSMSKEFETAIVDLHDIMKFGMPFQRKGVVFKRGDQPPKRKALSVLEQGLLGNHTEDNARKQSRLCSQNEELIGQQAMFSSLFPAADKQCNSSPVGKLITPSNSMEEEPMSPLSVE